MEIKLNQHERKLLMEILQERQRELMHEIWKTDDRKFKHMLHEREQLLDSLLDKLRVTEELAA